MSVQSIDDYKARFKINGRGAPIGALSSSRSRQRHSAAHKEALRFINSMGLGAMIRPAMREREFRCVDCGAEVCSLGEPHANDQDMCATCLWLRAVEDDRERERLRAFLMIGRK